MINNNESLTSESMPDRQNQNLIKLNNSNIKIKSERPFDKIYKSITTIHKTPEMLKKESIPSNKKKLKFLAESINENIIKSNSSPITTEREDTTQNVYNQIEKQSDQIEISDKSLSEQSNLNDITSKIEIVKDTSKSIISSDNDTKDFELETGIVSPKTLSNINKYNHDLIEKDTNIKYLNNSYISTLKTKNKEKKLIESLKNLKKKVHNISYN